MIRLTESNRRSTLFERLLWCAVALISLVPLIAVLSGNPAGLITDYRMALALFLAGVAAVGLILNWGPMIPCAILGIVILMISTDPMARSHEEALFKGLGIPLIGAVLGAVIGFVIDRDLTRSSTSGRIRDEAIEDDLD